jgi:hypothetical protein
MYSLAMAFSIPQYSREEVNKAGIWLISTQNSVSLSERDHALNVINNWRASHGFPLQSFKMTLLSRAKRIDPKALVAQRLKRLPSIEAKLRRFPEMKLTQVQDIGGCRAVVRSVGHVERLVRAYKIGTAKNPTKRHEFVKEKDYITEPKRDGYRSVHLIYRYRSASKKHGVYNRLKVEIQLRSRLQHAWATAVETVDVFTRQALKSGGGQERWRRFFALMSGAIALRERGPIVPGTPIRWEELAKELRVLANALRVRDSLEGYRYAVTLMPSRNTKNAAAFLVGFNTATYTVSTQGYTKDELPEANEAYLKLEKELASKPPGSQAVLISADSVQALRSAYRNFYIDTGEFLKALRFAVGQTH